ncbi:hypothetical protein GCM10029964_009320 [Kibdelosporangium lantanae]
MDFDLDPPNGVGPLRLGMSQAEAVAALHALHDRPGPPGSDVHVFRSSDLMVRIECQDGRLVSVEFGRPPTGLTDRVLFRGVDVFTPSARDVVEKLSEIVRIEADPDDDASYLAPDLLLAFWRPFEGDDDPDDPQGYYFNSVLVARPGYYD